MQSLGAGRKFICGDQVRAECAGAVKVLSYRPLRRLPLIVANRSVIEDGIAKHVVECVFLADVSSSDTDDGDHFAFVVKLRGYLGTGDRCAGADETGSETRKDGGIIGHLEAALN